MKYIDVIISIFVIHKKIEVDSRAENLKHKIILNHNETFLSNEGVSDSICDNKISLLYKTLTSNDLSLEEKGKQFRLFLGMVLNSDNAGKKQGLLLCLVSILLFFLLNERLVGSQLIKAWKAGKVKSAMVKLILRRLKKAGYNVNEVSNLLEEANINY